MRFLSSDGWNEKSTLSRVFGGVSFAVLRATPTRRFLAHVEFLGEQRVDGLEGADLASLETLDDVPEGLQGARHVEADEA